MKHLHYLLLAFGFLFMASCSTHKVQGVNLNGKWTLNSISTTEGGKFKITVFNDIPSSCLVGSTWELTNSGYGTYTIQEGSECTAGTTEIYWSTPEQNGIKYFQFKIVPKGEKPKNVETGYKMEISSASDNAMILRSPTMVEEKTVTVIYSFTKAE